MAFCDKVAVLLRTVVAVGERHIVIQVRWLFIGLGILYRSILIFSEMCGAQQQNDTFLGGRQWRNVNVFSVHPKSLGSEAGSASSAPFLIELRLACS